MEAPGRSSGERKKLGRTSGMGVDRPELQAKVGIPPRGCTRGGRVTRTRAGEAPLLGDKRRHDFDFAWGYDYNNVGLLCPTIAIDRMTSISVYASTLRMLPPFKKGASLSPPDGTRGRRRNGQHCGQELFGHQEVITLTEPSSLRFELNPAASSAQRTASNESCLAGIDVSPSDSSENSES